MRALFVSVWILACGGCSTGYTDYIVRESNYLTYEHAFTDAATEAVRKSAERYCSETKHLAVRTRNACSLTRCTSHYQCMDQESAARAAPADSKR